MLKLGEKVREIICAFSSTVSVEIADACIHHYYCYFLKIK